MSARRAFALLAVLIAACAKAPPVPTDRFYRLPEPDAVAQARLTDGVIAVRGLQADGLYRERAIVYTDERGIALARHHYHFWIDPPIQLVRRRLVAFLRGAGAADMVLASEESADLVVSGRLTSFERVLDDVPRARAGIELALATGDGRILVLREYAAEVEAGGDDVEDSVAALDRALDRIFTEFLADARAAIAGLE